MVLRGIVSSCVLLSCDSGVAWYCLVWRVLMVFFGIAWYCVALRGIVWYFAAVGGIARYCAELWSFVVSCGKA